MTSQQQADILLQQWRDERMEALMADCFLPPPETEDLFEITLRNVAMEMADHD